MQVEENRITFAGDEALAPAFGADEIIDAKGGIVMPAFYNSHCHAAMALLRGAGSDKPLMDWLLLGMRGFRSPVWWLLPSFAAWTAALLVRAIQVLMKRAVEMQTESDLTV